MAELYEQPKLYANRPAGVTPISGDPDLDKVLAELPPEEREMAMQKITAPPTGEEIAQAMQERNANGELFNMTLDQYRLYKAHQKNKEVDIISTFGQAASGIYDEITKAGESIVNDPTNAVAKLTPSLIEAFAQGTRNLYGMAAQSVDPSSVMFRMKNALSANGSDEEAEYRQFMEAQQFNVHSMNLMSGKETLVMDKDVINPEMTQVMSYVADPTLFIPFGGIAMKGARMVGMGEGLAKASARASMIRNKILGGTLKWGVGAPIEFMGSAVRNTIDYGLERGSQAFEFATGMPAAEARATAQMYGLQSTSAALSGQTIPLPVVGNIAGAMVGSTTARGVGEALVTLGDQIYKQSKHGRGVLSYAGQALRDTEKSGVVLSNHAKGLLKVIDMADPLFVYSADMAEGAVTGMGIGGGLGYLAGGEEGMASGAGAGFALGAIGGGLGGVTADVTNNRLYDRIAIQRKMVIEGLKGTDDVKASALEAFAKVGEMNAERTGNRRLQAEIDGMIAGIDIMTPNAKFNIRSTAEHTAWLKSLKIDPNTGLMEEPSAILPQFGTDRKQRATALSFLSMVSDNFSGLPENLRQHIDALPADHAMKKHWARLSDDVKKVVMDEVKQNANIEYRKQFGGKKANEFYGDINYAEAHTARINSLFDSGNPTQARERINMLLKEETKGGKLTKRGELLKEKLSTEGYFDKDGNLRPSRIKEAELTTDVYKNVAGFVIRRDSTGQVEINLNTDTMGRDTAVHELFHAIMLESPMKDEFIDRLSTKLLGKFDANGKRLEGASVDTNQVKKFFQRYIDSKFRNNPTERANEMKRLERAVEEYEQRGDQNKVNRTTESTLEHMVEEFGAFYFPKFIQDKPVDFLFRGGELGAMREMFQSVKFGWLDFWRDKIGTRNPELNFDAVQGYAISQAFGKDGQPRYKNKALDLFMQDFVRATAMANRNGQFDITRLSNDAQKTFIKNNGIRGYGTIDKDGKVVRLNRRTALKEEMRVGKEIYKIVAGIDPKYRQGLTIDGEGNFSGRISPELAEELVKSGHVDRAWVDKLLRAYDIVDGKGSNVIEFGYLGRTAQIGDYAWPRLVGSDVPFKNRKAILLDVDFKVGKDGRMTALYHTLDHAVIEGRANTLWSDPAVRQLWDGDRGSMEADFFRYLSNASLPSDHPDRVSSAKLLEDGTGKGAMRRNAMHQMLGMAKLDGDVYINKPIAEIPLGIRHSVTTFNVDGVSGLRVRDGARYDYNHRNAFRDLSRNFMMSEMASEETPNGKILKHGTGYKITKMAGSNRFSVFDVDGKELGRFDTLADAGRAAQKDYNKKFDAKVEGKDVPVPRTEIPPSRIKYSDKRLQDILDKNDIEKRVIEELENSIQAEQQKNISEQVLALNTRYWRESLDLIRSKGLIEAFKNVDLHLTIDIPKKGEQEFKGKPWKSVRTLIDEIREIAHKEYDAMYPMEIKSALHGRLAQIFQDYPNLTAQGLLKKLDVYGSQGYRYLQEAKEIGLVDLLKSKIKPQKEIYRKMDASGNFTGEVATRELPVIFREISVEMKDEDGKPILDENGFPMKETRQTNENIQGTQPVLDMQEILDFAKSKEIKLTIEEGAKEVKRMDTERLTLGGDKSNYKETAVRINPEYAHGIQGHYGENTVVHFRTTERLDAEGNKVLFIEEVQANNPYTDKTDSTQKRKVDVPTLKLSLNILNDIRTKGIDSGILVIKGNGSVETALGDLLDRDVGNNPYLWKRYKEGVVNEIGNILGSDVSNIHLDHIKIGNKFRNELEDFILEHHNKGVKVTEDDIFYYLNDALASHEVALVEQIRANRPESVFKFIDKAIELNNKYIDFIEKNKGTNVKVPSEFGVSDNIWNIVPRLDERISDLKTGIQQAIANEKSFPLTRKKDWTLTALKGIIRQAIRDGLDTITLTHPDDSPTVSHMAKNARHGLYGKIIPETWGSWLRKYGIEIAQQNKLRDASLEIYRKNLVEVQNKIPEANKAVMDRFQQVMSGEDPANIKTLSELLSTPVHEMTDNHVITMARVADRIKDVELKNKVNDLINLKGAEIHSYQQIEVGRSNGIREMSGKVEDLNKGIGRNISAESIDRGMTFKLNDAIKRDFLDGKIKTHAMPEEGEASYIGGRTYDQNGKEWKTGFIGLWAEENPDRLKGKNIEFFKKADGSYRIRMQDNSSGQTRDVGHITASISQNIATLSSNIDPAFRGNKLSYALYSEMAERLRAMGVERVEGQIVNKDGIPIKIREAIIGDTRDYFSGRLISQAEGARRIREKQKMVGSMGGVDVYNELYQNARYQPSEGWEKSRELGMKSTWNNLPEVSRKLLQLNIDTFGLTNNAYEAGYILPDARMLDFSGRSQSSGFKRVNGKNVPTTKFDEFKDSRQIDHREAVMLPEEEKKMKEEYGWEEDKIGKMQQAGAIRIDHSNYGKDDGRTYLDIGSIPTNKQYEAILDIIKNSVVNKEKHTLGVDIRVNGRAINHPLHDMSVENPERVILALKREVNKAFKQENNKPKFQPAEGEQGGRTYTDDQFNKEFIGKFASENPEIANKFFIRIKENDGGTMEDWQYKMVIYDKDTKKAVARTKWQIFENDDGIAEDAAADVEILNDAYKGMKLSHLMQSERLERSRFLGAEKVRSQITNEEGIPIKNYAKTIGADKGEITSSFADRFNEDGSIKYIPATMENFKQEMDLSKAHADGTWKPTVYYRADLDPKAWYMMAEDNKIGSNSSNIKLLLEGLESGRIIRTSSYKGLGLEDAELIAHTPDTAKVGTITAGDKALGEMQGGVFYAIANGNLIWASNFAGEDNTNVLLKYAQDALAKNPEKRTYIMLVKPENSKNFSAKEGARVVTSIFSHLNDTGVITNDKIVKALKNAAENNLGMKFSESATKQDVVRQIDERILTATPEEVSFGKRGAYALDIVRELNASKAFKNKERIKKLEASFHNASFPRGLTLEAFKEVFGNLLAEDFIKDVPVGHVYGALEITKPLKETTDSRHRGYDRGIMHEDESPAKLILFDKTAHVTEIVNKGNPSRSDYNQPIKMWDKEGDGSQYHSWTGGNIPYQQVKGKSNMPFQPAEGWRDWQSERTSVGSVIKNTAGYLIMVQNGKFKVYNPAKAMIGIYDNEEQAKRRVQKDEPRR